MAIATADEIVAASHLGAWQGTAWRFHKQAYGVFDATGSLLYSGRYHRGRDHFPAEQTWPAFYLSLQPETCLGEVLRHFSPERLHQLNQYRLTEISALFSVVLDCRQIDLQAFDPELLLHATDYSLTQEIGAAAISAGAEAILIPSATKLGDNLVVFPDQLQPDSALRISGSRDPVLYVDR